MRLPANNAAEAIVIMLAVYTRLEEASQVPTDNMQEHSLL